QRAVDPVVGLPQQLLRLLVSPLRRADEPERHRGRRERRFVVRADRLPGCEREAFRLVDPSLREQQLGQAALALAERGAVLERRQQPDRLAEDPLRLREVALVAGNPAGEVEGAAERPGGPRLGEMLTGSLERRRCVLELPALEMKLTREAQRAAPGLRAAALLGEQDRLLDQGRRTIELQTRDVDARQL